MVTAMPRRITGVLALVLGVAALYAVIKIKEASGNTYEASEGPVVYYALDYIVGVWLILSALNKVGMVLNQKLVRLNVLALIAFYVMIFGTWFFTTPNEDSMKSVTDLLVTLVALGWPLVDLIDYVFLYDRKTAKVDKGRVGRNGAAGNLSKSN